MRSVVVLLLALATLASATNYHRYKVVSVRPRSPEEATLVRSIVNKMGLDQWTDPKAWSAALDILVPPRHTYFFLNGLRRRHIPATIKINDVQAVIDQQAVQRKATKALPRQFDHTTYHTLEELYAILDGLESDSEMVSTYTATTTYEGRDIRVAKVSVGADDTKPVIWIDCGIHAREWIAPATCQWILDQLTSGYGSNSEVTALLDTYDFHIMPSVNPDGYAFTWSDDRMWRKNRFPSGGFFDCHGIDPNRNFDSDFGGPGTSNDPCSDIYHGESAFSEKESQGVRDSINALAGRVKMFFTIHSYSQLWMTPYGYTYSLPANYDDQYHVASMGVEALRAVHGTYFEYGNIANTIYPAAGGSSDWAYDGAGIQYAFALELRDTGSWGFLLPADQIVPVGEETWAGIIAAINAV